MGNSIVPDVSFIFVIFHHVSPIFFIITCFTMYSFISNLSPCVNVILLTPRINKFRINFSLCSFRFYDQRLELESKYV